MLDEPSRWHDLDRSAHLQRQAERAHAEKRRLTRVRGAERVRDNEGRLGARPVRSQPATQPCYAQWLTPSPTSRRLLHAAGVPFVAGWSSIVADAAAPFFARGFLAALQRGADYAEAFEQGKLGVTTPTEGPDPSLEVLKTPTNNLIGTAATQRFELVDPKSRASSGAPLLVQPIHIL